MWSSMCGLQLRNNSLDKDASDYYLRFPRAIQSELGEVECIIVELATNWLGVSLF